MHSELVNYDIDALVCHAGEEQNAEQRKAFCRIDDEHFSSHSRKSQNKIKEIQRQGGRIFRGGEKE